MPKSLQIQKRCKEEDGSKLLNLVTDLDGVAIYSGNYLFEVRMLFRNFGMCNYEDVGTV